MTKICKTAILMATYNGERHLREQLDSLFLQTNQDWHLFVHDDGSTDATVSIVQDYVKRHPDMVTLLPATRRSMPQLHQYVGNR